VQKTKVFTTAYRIGICLTMKPANSLSAANSNWRYNVKFCIMAEVLA